MSDLGMGQGFEELKQVRETFLAESSELLHEMELSLLGLESSPGDHAFMNALFRAAHTIKGSAGIVGFTKVEKFTHLVENLLSLVRENKTSADEVIIGLLLECKDHIEGIIGAESAQTSAESEEMEREEGLVRRLNFFLKQETTESQAGDCQRGKTGGAQEQTRAETGAWHISIRFGKDVLRHGLDPVPFINYLSRIGETVSLSVLLDSMPRPEDMDPESCYLGLEIDLRSDFGKKDIEDVFEFIREDSSIRILPPNSRIEEYLDLIRTLPEDPVLLGEILVRGGALSGAELDDALKMQNGCAASGAGAPGQAPRRALGEILVKEGTVPREIVEDLLDRQKGNVGARAKEAGSVRIDAAKLDVLVNQVGELVIASANMAQRIQSAKDPVLLEAASVVSRLVENVRDNAMNLRMVPVGETFSRFKRIIRDIARDTGKEIEMEISGSETELDKTVVEKISDPLMHIVRNAADHGLEASEERVRKGKPSKGVIRLNACHDAGSIVIEVFDDGRGLDRKKILDKALRLGLVQPGHAVNDRELSAIIFEPGFSTAEQVTKLSGRGVGMDVVKRNIEALRGTVEVESEEDRGTTVRIRLPLTLAIIDGFMVGIGDSRYVIPLDMIVECVERQGACGKKGYMNLRGKVLPFIRLDEFLEEESSLGCPKIVVVQHTRQCTGLAVDEFFGEVQAVIKSLGAAFRKVEGISGATILGDGRVALILDVPRIISVSGKQAIDTACA